MGSPKRVVYSAESGWRRSMNRRAFLTAFAAASAGMAVAEKAGFFEEFLKWWQGPEKTIFIPPAKKIELYDMQTYLYKIIYTGPPIPTDYKYFNQLVYAK
jgi:hypothetical protein